MRLLWRKRIHTRSESLLGGREQAILAKQIRKRQTSDAAAKISEQLTPRIDQLLEMTALRAMTMMKMGAHISSVPVRKLVQIEERVTEIRQAGLSDKRDRFLAFETVGLTRERQRKCVIDLLLDVLTGILPHAIREDARLRQHHAVVHQDQRLRRNLGAVPPIGGIDEIRLVERLEHRVPDAALEEHIQAAPPR